jgi:hypothetical protein
MEPKRTVTKADEQALKHKVAFFLLILMVLSLTVCSYPKQETAPEETSAPTEDTSFRLPDSEDSF